MTNMMNQTTAGRQIHQVENKARLFIERQRKRTATLGAQRQKYSYHANKMRPIDQQSKSNSPARAENGTASDSREGALRPPELASEQSVMQMSN